MKNDIKQVKTIYLHGGKFFLDDVVSAALVKMVNSEVTFVRTAQAVSTNDSSVCMGVRGSNDWFSTNKLTLDEFGNPNSLTSLVWQQLANELLNKANITNVQVAKQLFYDRFVSVISVGTRYGFVNADRYVGEVGIVAKMNAEWYEEANGIITNNNQFDKTVTMMTIIVENWFKQVRQDSDFREVEDEIWNKAEQNSENGIYVLERYIPWQYQIKNRPDTDAKIIIFQSNRGDYNLVSKSIEEIKIQPNEQLSFLHPSGFMGTAKTLEDAICAARYSLRAA